MRKTLLIAAAALAGSIISSQAQVYSQNIVGYVNLSLTSGQLALVSPALDADGTGTNNTISTVFTTPALGDVVYAFNGTGFTLLTYKAPPRGSTSGTNWYVGSTAEPNYSINPGQSVFYLPAATETATEVGIALTGTQVNQFVPAAGQLNLVASKSPIGGGLTSVLDYMPNLGDSAYTYAGGSYTLYEYKAPPRGSTNGTNWYIGSTYSEPVINVGEGFWLQPAAANTWTQDVQP